MSLFRHTTCTYLNNHFDKVLKITQITMLLSLSQQLSSFRVRKVQRQNTHKMAGPKTQIILMRAHGNKHDHCTPCGLIESFKKLNSRYKTSVPGAYPVAAHPSFLSMKWLRSIFPPNRMGSQLITTGGERHCGRKVFWPRTQYNDLARSWTQTSWLRVHCMNQSGHNIF